MPLRATPIAQRATQTALRVTPMVLRARAVPRQLAGVRAAANQLPAQRRAEGQPDSWDDLYGGRIPALLVSPWLDPGVCMAP